MPSLFSDIQNVIKKVVQKKSGISTYTRGYHIQNQVLQFSTGLNLVFVTIERYQP